MASATQNSARPLGLLGLTDRETEILGLIVAGHTNSVIARDLFLSEKTVRNHITNIFTKIGVTDRAAAAQRARDNGLIGRNPGLPWEPH